MEKGNITGGDTDNQNVAFCRVPEIGASEEMVSKIPLILQIMTQQLDFSILVECYESLMLVSTVYEDGVVMLFESGAMKVLALQMLSLPDGSHIFELSVRLIQLILSKISLDTVIKEYLTEMLMMVPCISRQFALLQNALKFELLHLLSIVLSSHHSAPLHNALRSMSNEKWPSYVRAGVMDILQNRVAPDHKLQALILAESLVTMLGEGWLIAQMDVPDIKNSTKSDRCLLLILESSRVEVAVLLNDLGYLKYEASSPQVEAISVKRQNLAIAFSMVEKIIKLISNIVEDEGTPFPCQPIPRLPIPRQNGKPWIFWLFSTLTFGPAFDRQLLTTEYLHVIVWSPDVDDQSFKISASKENTPPITFQLLIGGGSIISESTFTKVISGLNETIGVVLEYLKDAKDHGQRKGDDLLASVRVVGSYLAETPLACKEKVRELLGYMLSVEGEDESSPFFSTRFLLPMLCQTTMKIEGAKILASSGGYKAVVDCLVKLICPGLHTVEDDGSIYLACDTILNLLLKREQIQIQLDVSVLIPLLKALAVWTKATDDSSVIMMASSICSLIFEDTSEVALLRYPDFENATLNSISQLIRRSLAVRGQDMCDDTKSDADLHDIITEGYSRWADRFPRVRATIEG